MYLLVESGREQIKKGQTALRDGIGMITHHLLQSIADMYVNTAALEPNLLLLLVQLISKLRWDDTTDLPLTRVSRMVLAYHKA